MILVRIRKHGFSMLWKRLLAPHRTTKNTTPRSRSWLVFIHCRWKRDHHFLHRWAGAVPLALAPEKADRLVKTPPLRLIFIQPTKPPTYRYEAIMLLSDVGILYQIDMYQVMNQGSICCSIQPILPALAPLAVPLSRAQLALQPLLRKVQAHPVINQFLNAPFFKAAIKA